MDTKILIFDFDKTLTDVHSCGMPSIGSLYWTNSDNLSILVNTLAKLKSQGFKIFIVSRGLKDMIETYTDMYIPDIFDGIYGANEFYPISKFQYEMDQCDTLYWATIKLVYILEIMIKNNIVDKKCVYFFDDTEVNVLETKHSGFVNSFHITGKSKGTLEKLNELFANKATPMFDVKIVDQKFITDKFNELINANITNKYLVRISSQPTIFFLNDVFDDNIINTFTVEALIGHECRKLMVVEIKIDNSEYNTVYKWCDPYGSPSEQNFYKFSDVVTAWNPLLVHIDT